MNEIPEIRNPCFVIGKTRIVVRECFELNGKPLKQLVQDYIIKAAEGEKINEREESLWK